jgi:hypothetical protein
VEGSPPSTLCTSTIRLLISYLAAITLKGEESYCHGTRVLIWSGRAVPNARVTDTAQSATSRKRQTTFRKEKRLGQAHSAPYVQSTERSTTVLEGSVPLPSPPLLKGEELCRTPHRTACTMSFRKMATSGDLRRFCNSMQLPNHKTI